MILRRWNYVNKKYEPFEIPDEWNVKLWSILEDEASKTVNCPSCGCSVSLGDTYTSLEIHNEMGLGYWVCPKCHKKEMERRALWKKN